MGLVPHHELVTSTAPFVTAFGTIFTHGVWAGKLVAALAVVSGIGALNGWTLVTQALILVLAGVVIYAFLKAHRENTGQVPVPIEAAPAEDSAEA